MFKGLKIAVKRQRKLLVIFAITIFLPSVSLSIFGIIALRNEKFRIAQEIETEQLQIANSIKANILSWLTDTRERIENLAGYPSVRQKDYTAIKELITELSNEDSLARIIFLLFQDEEPFFPLFQTVLEENGNRPKVVYNNSLQQQIRHAEDAEYVQNDYVRAASTYHNAFVQSGSNTIKARMLNHKARNLMKAKKYADAADVYSEIIHDFPEERTASGLPLELYAKIQKTDCYVLMGDKVSATLNDLNAFKELIAGRWDLNESQFRTYSSIVMERLAGFISEDNENSAVYVPQFESLQEQFQNRIGQWQEINNIISFIVPELTGYLRNNEDTNYPVQYSKRIGNEDYLILTVGIPEKDQADNTGIVGVKVDNQYLRNTILHNAFEENQPWQNTAMYIASLSGDSIKGYKNQTADAITTTALFDDNFPPWRFELAYIGPKSLRETNIFSNFFFWTIITLIIILAFGTAMIVRIVNQEIEILKIKSDFVSSVSHEFKTPLTSMKSLTERIEKGKVIQPAKLDQYISIISSDIDKLILLVSNILNFSKIEEGKKVYNMENTEVSIWLGEVIDNFKKEGIERDRAMDIHLQIEEGIADVNIDRDAMRQVLFNLLDNAVKFSGGNRKVEVTAQEVNHSVIIQVKDQGIGIEDDEKEKVYEKFYRGENAIEYSIKGTGLGLALVRYTIEAHNGHINIENEAGWSTVFRIQLPITKYK